MCLGIPGRVLALNIEDDIATVLVSGVERDINIALVSPGVSPGDWVLVHAGFALSTLSEDDARETLDLLREMSDTFAGELPSVPAPTGDR